MNIENWPIGRICQLPDYVFGRRWPIALANQVINVTPTWDITEAGLPDRTMIWEMVLIGPGSTLAMCQVHLRIGEIIPATLPEFMLLRPLFRECVDQAGVPSSFVLAAGMGTAARRLRQPVNMQGQKIVAYFTTASEVTLWLQVILVISAVPKEVPDWILSGPVKMQ